MVDLAKGCGVFWDIFRDVVRSRALDDHLGSHGLRTREKCMCEASQTLQLPISKEVSPEMAPQASVHNYLFISID
jgi:hypothetical protein